MKILFFLLAFFGITKLEPSIAPIPTYIAPKFSFPTANFDKVILKKPFGIYITPQSSPVKPEHFKGSHTGVDAEYPDVDGDVEVNSIADGTIVYSGFVSGYGGLVAIQYTDFIGIYGHLRPSSLVKNKTNVKKGQQIGVLGTAYSKETDGERRHLHFAILKGTKLDFRGYVQKETELSKWIDPIKLFNQNIDSQPLF